MSISSKWFPQYKNILGEIIMNNLEHNVTRLEVYVINSLKFVCNKMLQQVVGVVLLLHWVHYFHEFYILNEFLRLVRPLASWWLPS